LQISGPGYLAKGCQGETRYKMMEAIRVDQKTPNTLKVAKIGLLVRWRR
jgi:hypothetical protein